MSSVIGVVMNTGLISSVSGYASTIKDTVTETVKSKVSHLLGLIQAFNRVMCVRVSCVFVDIHW